MPSDAELEKRLAEAGPLVDSTERRAAKALAGLADQCAKLKAAIAAHEAPMIKLLQAELALSVKRGEQEQRNIDYVLGEPIDGLREDERFAEAHATEIERMVERLAKLQRRLADSFPPAEALLSDAAKAGEKEKSSKAAAVRELQALDLKITEFAEELASIARSTAESQQKAADAYAAREAAALRSEQSLLDDLAYDTAMKEPDSLPGELDAFLKKWKGHGLGEETEKQFDTIAARLRDKVAKMRPLVKQSVDAMKAIRAYKLTAPDAKAALKALDLGNLPPKAKAAFEKALTLPTKAMEKAFDAIAKEQKMKASGKKWIETLAKQRVL